MAETVVASSEFQNQVGRYLDSAARAPVFITRHKRRVRVLLDIEEYERLKARDTRRALPVEELDEGWIEALETIDVSHLDPGLDRLLDEK